MKSQLKSTLLLITTICLLVSCVSKNKYEDTQQEKEALAKELEELKFGLPNLLADAKKFIEAREYAQAKEKLNTLLQKYDDRPESAEARSLLRQIEEEETWTNALNSTDIQYTQSYISNFSDGKYIALAKDRINELKIANEEDAYQNAMSINSSEVWKEFISNYPNREDIEDIKKQIIKCEVNEIMGDRRTGELPSFNQTSYGYSSSSSVSITNDTECILTVRYSGSDVKMIEIPAGGTRSVNLSSGNYQIAASACGSNYAGTEQLQGSYSSKYYIVRTRF